MKYHYQSNIDRRKRRLKMTHRTLLVVLFLVIVIVVVLSWIGLQYMWGEISTKEGPSTDKGYFSGSSKTTYDNGVFSFMSAKNWVIDERSSQPPKKFVYLSQKGPNVEYIMTVFLGDIPQTPVKYVLPVRTNGNRMSSDLISPKCGSEEKDVITSDAPTAATVANTEYKGIKFVCKMEGFENLVALGHEGGGYSLPLTNSKGEAAPVSMVFQDLAINLQLDPVREVINSFTVK
jgi:hypothetical protein